MCRAMKPAVICFFSLKTVFQNRVMLSMPS